MNKPAGEVGSYDYRAPRKAIVKGKALSVVIVFSIGRRKGKDALSSYTILDSGFRMTHRW